MDLIVCRNLFIYLKPEIQNSILRKFCYAFNQDGFLFLGSSEGISGIDAFIVADIKWKMYQFVQNRSTSFYSSAIQKNFVTVPVPRYLKNRQLSILKCDLNNLVRDLDAGVMFLDVHLRIRSLTPEVTSLTGISSSDVGRSIWKVRIRPYRTECSAVDGVVLTMLDVTELIREQHQVREIQCRLDNTMKISNSAWWEYEPATGTVRYSAGKATMLGYTAEEFPDNVYQICEYIHPDDYDKTMETMRRYLEGTGREWNIVYRMKSRDGHYLWVHDVGHISEWTKEGKPKKVIGSVMNYNLNSIDE